MDDDALDEWVEGNFDKAVGEEWTFFGERARGEGRKFGAVKADLFRYLVLLHRGGVYVRSISSFSMVSR